jgi:hypothetical protein
MKNFKGFGDWVEIFQGGKQTDSTGVVHDGDAMIDKAVQTFDPSYHEPPLVAGHPKDNAPAYGWVSGLKKTGNSLFAKFSQVVPEFSKACETGLFKKRSASFYPDGRLRHVGFLGAMPPAVKGLKDLAFSDDDHAVTFEFGDSWTWETVGGIFRKMRDYFIEKEGKETADRIIPDWDVEYIRDTAKTSNDKEEDMQFSDFLEAFKFWKKIEGGSDVNIPAAPAAGSKTFTEADINQAKQDAVKAEREKLDAEFAEKQRQSKREATRQEISTWCDTLAASGKIPPSWVDSGLASFMQGLDSEKEVSFSEKGEKKTGLQWFKDFLEGFGKSTLFSELATKEKAGDSAEFAESKADQAIGESIAAKVEQKK